MSDLKAQALRARAAALLKQKTADQYDNPNYGMKPQRTTDDMMRDNPFGLDMSLRRGQVLPLARKPVDPGMTAEEDPGTAQGEVTLATPQFLVDLIKRVGTPGHVMQGGAYNMEDIVGTAGTMLGGRPVGQVKGGPDTRTRIRKEAPEPDALKAEAKKFYDLAEKSQARVDANEGRRALSNLGTEMVEDGFTPSVHKKSHGLMREWAKEFEADDLKELSFQQLERMRRQAAEVAKDVDAQGRVSADARFGIIMQDRIDDLIERLPVSGAARRARDAWRRKTKGEDIAEMIRRADLSASGFENGLRNEFRSLAKRKKAFNRFSKAERRAIENVIKGGPVRNFMRWVRHYGLPSGGENRALGAAMGAGLGSTFGAAIAPKVGLDPFTGGMIGGTTALVGGNLAGRGARRGTVNAAELARAMAASGRQPNATTLGGALKSSPRALSGGILTEYLLSRGR